MYDLTSDLKKLLQGKPLSEQACYTLFENFLDKSPVQQAAVLTLFTKNGVSVAELTGALRFFLSQSTQLTYQKPLLDIVGTGGDGLGTFNISTAASLVIASAGVPVAKHGGRSSTSLSGSTDVIKELGIPCFSEPPLMKHSLDKNNYVYVAGALFNPLLQQLGPLRKTLGFQTFLNILGPLGNPFSPERCVIGVYSEDLLPIVAQVLFDRGTQHAMVVHSEEGLDEFSISGKSSVMEVTPAGIKAYTVTPESAGLPRYPLDAVKGGGPKENAQIIRGIFSGEITGAKLAIVLLNAASGLVVAQKAETLAQGVDVARECIESGKTQSLLQDLHSPLC